MTSATQESKAGRITELVDYLQGRLAADQAPPIEHFLKTYYEWVAPEDVVDRPVEALYGAAFNAWKLGERRAPGRPKVRVYNPVFDQHGWSSPHTIVEIVNDDMPFLVDSVGGEIDRLGLTNHLIVHPVIRVRRDDDGNRIALLDREEEAADAIAESVMHLEVDAVSADERLEVIRLGIEKVLGDVRAAVEDWEPMRARLRDAIEGLERRPPQLPAEEVDEVRDFLDWAGDDHFTFLGCRDYDVVRGNGTFTHKVVEGSSLGVLRDPGVQILRGRTELAALTEEVRHFLDTPDPIIITKANVRATVHRRVHMDYIGVKRYGASGEVVGERRFVGLFTSVAYNRTPGDIPYLRRKIARTLTRAGFEPSSHDAKALLNVLETYPRDELFQIEEDTLFDITTGILLLQERPRIGLFVRRDRFGRFCSCLVFIPREQYTTTLRNQVEDILASAFGGRVSAYYTLLGNSALARLHVIVVATGAAMATPDLEVVEAQIVRAARSWKDDLYGALIEHFAEEEGNRLRGIYLDAFPIAYRDSFTPREALLDIEQMEALGASGAIGINLHRPLEADDDSVRLKIYNCDDPIALSDCLPILENLGLRVIEELPYCVSRQNGEARVWIQDFLLVEPGGRAFDPGPVKSAFQEAFVRVWSGAAQDDGFNRLVLRAGLTWREVMMLRAGCKYLRQAQIPFSQNYMEDTLYRHPDIAVMLIALFHGRFDPAKADEAGRTVSSLLVAINEALEKVESLDEDRILRRYLELIQATLRTNFYQPGADSEPKPYFSFKIDSMAIAELPLPRPLTEIFVYSPRVEAVHLRGGKVARGGIRWSDRREDFRTEVLGLMKAQMVKNAVIVPVGSKGGFVCKALPRSGERAAVMAEVIACYETMMRGMLDLTDNLVGGAVRKPPECVCHDVDDPYLVVAADKGTATFSDIANGIAKDYGFWLGDAFASGGSEGYDHKKMGITARGAWESVKRHFRELGIDTQNEDFTVIGVGDMSGDVFGNGMLLSQHIKLLAAFNHLHIFFDPDPDPTVSFAERQRLFALPRSSWSEYDPSLISEGGGVFERRAKSIELSPQMQALIETPRDHMTPNELVRALIKMPADLLWFGGIGTYVKARGETNAEVDDRANDALRIDANEVHCKVVGEGANLGLTQRGRIEFAAAGGRINTDAIDNSAGVDCSDHEVNIKILLNAVSEDGEITEKQRNRRLAEMTDEVAELVLRHNYMQTQAISVALAQPERLLDAASHFMRKLERRGLLDRGLEHLPDDETTAERRTAGRGLTRPEIAVLLAYAKTTLYDQLLGSDVPEDPQLGTDLIRYFPVPLQEEFGGPITNHRLRRELVATSVANSLVNRAGPTFISDIEEETGQPANIVARAYAATREVFGLRELWTAIEGLDNRVDAAIQTRMLIEMIELVRRGTLWFIRNLPQPLDIARTVDSFAPGIAALAEVREGLLTDFDRDACLRRIESLIAEGVPEVVAARVAALDPLSAACDIVQAATSSERPVVDVGRVYFAVGAHLGLDWLRAAADIIAAEDYWQRLAVIVIVEDLYSQQRALTTRVIAAANGAVGEDAVAGWVELNRIAVARTRDLIAEFKAAGSIDVARLAVANRYVRSMIIGTS